MSTAAEARDGAGADGTASTEEQHDPSAAPAVLRRYVAVVLAFPVLLLVGTLIWMCTPEYQNHSQYVSFVGLGYGSRLHGANCDVVIDGDSSALTGAVPSVIEQRTGLKTCNIADVAGVKYVTGMAVLDDYLAHNRRPRYLIFLFVPENLTSPTQWDEVAHFEGWFYGLRYQRHRDLLVHALKSPEEFMVSLELGLRTGLQWLPQRALAPAIGRAREREHGHLAEPGASLQQCAPPLRQRAPDPRWLQQLRTRYSGAAQTLLIDVTPEPACDPSFAFYAARTGAGITDNVLGTLPLGDYTDSGRLHTGGEGSEILSERLADQILAHGATAPPTYAGAR